MSDNTAISMHQAPSTQTLESAEALRSWLTEKQAQIHQRFHQNQPVLDLLKERSALIDQLLQALWKNTPWPTFPSITLIAVGGYGRGELFPRSDIDLLLLREPGDIEALQEPLERFIQTLWDLGLKVGHAVRTLDDCLTQAATDLSTFTNLLESRVLEGPERLFHILHQKLNAKEMWPGIDFFREKMIEQEQRHHKNHNTEYYLEPNVKNAPGGLRDIQMLAWVTQRELGEVNTKVFSQLVEQGLMNQEEMNKLADGQTFVSRIRYALHLISQRDENRLLFDFQKSVAQLLGYDNTKAQSPMQGHNNDAVESFMQDYYRHAMIISELNHLLLEFFNEKFYETPAQQQIEPINENFQLRVQLIEVTHPDVFANDPSTLLSIFAIMGQNARIKGVRASTIRLLRKHRHLIDKNFRENKKHAAIFMDILRSPYRLHTQLDRMKRYGILGRYIPEFRKIVGKMQYDLFHIYTVDTHTLLVIQNMRKLRHPSSKDTFPIAANVIHFLPKIELLYLAGLFHDMAKGRGGDHSKLGALDAEQFCLDHALSKWDAHLVSWLVQNHLTMSIIAQKKDISDANVIHSFAHIVKDQIHLDYLYLLTVCDICATNPKLYNAWRADLLRQLYERTKQALRQGLKQKPGDDAKNESQNDSGRLLYDSFQETAQTLADKGFCLDEIKALWAELGNNYFIRTLPDEAQWHTEAILAHQVTQTDESQPIIQVLPIQSPLTNTADDSVVSRAHSQKQVFIYTKDRNSLFAASVSVLNRLGLSVQAAKIITAENGFSLDTYIVLDPVQAEDTQQRNQEIEQQLQAALNKPDIYRHIIEDFTRTTKNQLPRQLKYFDVPTAVNISNDFFNQRTVIEIRALDYPGLLAVIGKTFADFGIAIENAKIATLGECAEDVFFVVDKDRNPIGDAKLCEDLRNIIKENIDKRF